MKQLEAGKTKLFAVGLVTVLLSMLLVLTAFAARERYQLEETERAWWSDTTTARWKKVNKADKYQVRLYSGDQDLTRATVTTTFIDFSRYIEDGNDYSFSVRALAKNDSQISGEWVDSEVQTASGIGDTSGHWRNYQQGKKYQKDDKTYVTNDWHLISGEWYYFNEDGYMRTGWQSVNNLWYYLNDEGMMQTGWKELAGAWYYLRADGSMAVGWVEPRPGQWYYLYADGTMAANTAVDGCQLDASGMWIQ